jgi:hypothetical protein
MLLIQGTLLPFGNDKWNGLPVQVVGVARPPVSVGIKPIENKKIWGSEILHGKTLDGLTT